ncbi:MAG: GNAT family N-acetyltransferase [Phenylobacterium sp.]|uniref:GNAT family N-acetyltransferase n=1 Tax=Phenylobacterium sp. TaxID=1871053 RepID=UPI00271BD963|nr:GNAT family N-acetyltransferase [Phenylobacterium sp.]MDO8912482.1 GNAT family N-acetyltransferase [Phenylobacterium sp.]MDP2011573.1 GNAT family N-acetyltransferase [Phenylobacterium sp.]MDP3102708.1 GNAT family N-acetyltransferase [Phenylobacterium sp.]MDP3634872.1 GNAT family N-acetyltransferase [Phenylobacterium sp.]
MSVAIRPANPGDLAAILEFDPVARREERRHDYVSKALAGDRGMDVRVLVLDDEIAGYAVMAEFFGHPFLERICTAERYLRRGVAGALMANIEGQFEGDRMFVSCNESNQPMRTLLVARGYKVSGMVENLDPGDPELFFVIFRDALDAAIEAANA